MTTRDLIGAKGIVCHFDYEIQNNPIIENGGSDEMTTNLKDRIEWMPIETLPSASLSGERFLCGFWLSKKHWVEEIRTFKVTKKYAGFDYKRRGQCTTHWMPLPDPPNQ